LRGQDSNDFLKQKMATATYIIGNENTDWRRCCDISVNPAPDMKFNLLVYLLITSKSVMTLVDGARTEKCHRQRRNLQLMLLC